jgi:hypothetical protein
MIAEEGEREQGTGNREMKNAAPKQAYQAWRTWIRLFAKLIHQGGRKGIGRRE